MTRRARKGSRLAAALAGFVLLGSAAPPASAGMVFGPYLIWMNLAQDASADSAIHDYTHAAADADSCWNSQALLIYKDLPKGITPELVRRAVLKREPAAQARLRALLRKGDPELPGYDGVIVVPRSAKPVLMSFGTDGKVRSQAAVDKTGQPAWAEAFCDVQPPVLRKP